MSKFVQNLLTYPARWTGAAGTTVGAVFLLAAQFNWWHWTADQSQAVAGAASAFLGLLTAFGVHAAVTPNVRLEGPAVPAPAPAPDDPDIPAFVDPAAPPPGV